MPEREEASVWQVLRAPFPPEQIGTIPRGGVNLSYVGHAAVTDRLLQADPTWTWEPMGVDQHGCPIVEENEGGMAGEPLGLWIVLTVNGVTRPGFGGGKNAKECISDAIRNAAMRFGVALDLWAKEDLTSAISTPASAPREAKPVAFDNESARLEASLAEAMKELGTYGTDRHLVSERRTMVVKKQLPLVAYKEWLKDREATVRENIKVMGKKA